MIAGVVEDDEIVFVSARAQAATDRLDDADPALRRPRIDDAADVQVHADGQDADVANDLGFAAGSGRMSAFAVARRLGRPCTLRRCRLR